jgi:hypothetical protein
MEQQNKATPWCSSFSQRQTCYRTYRKHIYFLIWTIIFSSFTKMEDSYPSSSMVKSCKQFNESTELLRNLNPLTEIINCIMKEFDPEEAKELDELCDILNRENASLQAVHFISPSLHEGIAIIINCSRSGEHVDHSNTPGTWTPMIVIGSFSGGKIVLKSQGVRLRYNTGDFIMIKGREEFHEIEEWSRMLRMFYVYFTHESIWKEAGLR